MRWLLPLSLSLFALFVTPAAIAQPEADAPRIDNLEAFARLYGYLRFFHPSDEASTVDWDSLAVWGSRQAIDASTPQALRQRLNTVFTPIAPTLQLYLDGEEPAPVESFDGEVVAWQHRGVGLGSGGLYASARTHRENRMPVRGAPFAVVTQRAPDEVLGATRIRLLARARAEAGSRAQAWLRVDRAGGQRGFFDNMGDRPITEQGWREVLIEGPVAEDAVDVFFGFMLTGGDRAAVDDLRLEIEREGAWARVEITNGGFEASPVLEGFNSAPGWDYTAREEAAPAGERYLEISRRYRILDELFDRKPAAGEMVDKPLRRGLRCRFPLALPTLPLLPAGSEPSETPERLALKRALAELDLGSLDGDDLGFRLGNVIQLWNVFQHFYPYFDQVEVDWQAVLAIALERSLADRSRGDHRRTLAWMVAQLDDGHGNVFDPEHEQGRSSLPLVFGWADGEVVVLQAEPETGLARGDVVEAVDGRPAAQRLDEIAELISGSPRWKRHRALRELARGPRGGEVKLVLRLSPGRQVPSGELAGEQDAEAETPRPRETVAAGLQLTFRYEHGAHEVPQRPEIEEIEDGIFYVDLGRAEWPAIQEALDDLAQACGVVFDLRGYPRGNHQILQHLAAEPLQSARWNVPLQIYPDFEDPEWDTSGRWWLPPQTPRIAGKVAFLTGGGAISYAESVMAIVAHYRLGEIVGEATAGANGNVNPFNLPGGFRVAWTGMRVINHDGSQHHVRGVQPTIEAQPTIAGIRAGRDEVLERGLALLRGDG